MPTEAEWEYAARSGTSKDFWTGEGSELGGDASDNVCDSSVVILDGVNAPVFGDYAWFCGNAELSNEVAQKEPNGFGLYDMHGNLFEWNMDWIGCNYPQSSTNPYCFRSNVARIKRSGYWNNGPADMGASRRTSQGADDRYVFMGFRLTRRE